jgi:hypothetical protein
MLASFPPYSAWNRQAMVKVPDQKFVERGNHLNKKIASRRNHLKFVDFRLRWARSEGRDLMVRVERYRHYAVECVRLARESDCVAEKHLLLQMAEQWRRLAERAEKDEKKR